MGYHDIDALISQLQMFYKDVSSGKYGICIGPQDPNNPNCFPVHGGYVGIADESQQFSRPEPVRDWLESMLGVIQYRQSSQISFGPLLIQCAKILACIKNEGNSLIWQTPFDRTNNYGIYLTSMMFINPFLSVQGPRDEKNKSINAAKLDALPDGMKKTAMRRIETPIPAGAPAFVQPLINGSFDPLYAFPLVYVDYEHRSRSGEDSACLLFNPDKLNRLISKNSTDLMPLDTVDPATQTSFLPQEALISVG